MRAMGPLVVTAPTAIPELDRAIPCISLSFPSEIRLGDQGIVDLHLDTRPSCLSRLNEFGYSDFPDAEGSATKAAAELSHVIVEARLDLPGASLRPYEAISQPLFEAQSVGFVWSVVLSEPGTYRGTAWLSLTAVGGDPGHEERVVISAQSLEVRTQQLASMKGGTARLGGALGMLASATLALPFARGARNRNSLVRGVGGKH